MNYEFYMKKVLELASRSMGQVSPNPMVGCIIVDDDENIIAQGRHEKYGEAHAEQNALKLAGDKAKGSTLFVNLEPCNHWGKTPPCAKLIVEAGVKRVVIGTKDSNKKASGGIETLQNAGVEVICGVLEAECKKFNEIFLYSVVNARPFVAIKTATTLDGKIAARDNSSKWITSKKAREQVQILRNKYDAILTTARTVKLDNPSLTCRMQDGRNPIRIIVDKYGELCRNYKVFSEDGTQVIYYNGEFNLEFLKELYQNGIRSILIEAGGAFNGAIIAQGLVNKVYQFIAPKLLGDNDGISWVSGLSTNNINECKNFEIVAVHNYSPDIMLEIYPQL